MQDFEYQWGQIVARAWDDPAFKARLLADPAGVLRDHGVTPPAGASLAVTESADEAGCLFLPPKPPPQDLSEEELRGIGAGAGAGPGAEQCYRCGEACHRCGEERCYRCERC